MAAEGGGDGVSEAGPVVPPAPLVVTAAEEPTEEEWRRLREDLARKDEELVALQVHAWGMNRPIDEEVGPLYAFIQSMHSPSLHPPSTCSTR